MLECHLLMVWGPFQMISLSHLLLQNYAHILAYYWANTDIVRKALHIKKVCNNVFQQSDICDSEGDFS
ncbi:hypothetical protein B296_00058002 [Ensete ventricosum]|uniref:Uncharacterized protein n=1 Tax=Ensete ventricosum TaxID=4639 RepID=A0A426WXU9_ENSVE|nr:hypothetical protein B296_00058002 [Ensete ventricosum]